MDNVDPPDNAPFPDTDVQGNAQGPNLDATGEPFGTHPGVVPTYEPGNAGLFFPKANPENTSQIAFLQTIRGIIEEKRGNVDKDSFIETL